MPAASASQLPEVATVACAVGNMHAPLYKRTFLLLCTKPLHCSIVHEHAYVPMLRHVKTNLQNVKRANHRHGHFCTVSSSPHAITAMVAAYMSTAVSMYAATVCGQCWQHIPSSLTRAFNQQSPPPLVKRWDVTSQGQMLLPVHGRTAPLISIVHTRTGLCLLPITCLYAVLGKERRSSNSTRAPAN